MTWEPISRSSPKAAKPHKCIWCGQAILKGETHVLDCGKFEDDFQSNRYHNECNEAACAFFREWGDDGFEPYVNERPPSGGGKPAPMYCDECGERQDLDGAFHKPTCSSVT